MEINKIKKAAEVAKARTNGKTPGQLVEKKVSIRRIGLSPCLTRRAWRRRFMFNLMKNIALIC